MSSPISLSEGSLAALHHLREKREINTVTLRYADVTRASFRRSSET